MRSGSQLYRFSRLFSQVRFDARVGFHKPSQIKPVPKIHSIPKRKIGDEREWWYPIKGGHKQFHQDHFDWNAFLDSRNKTLRLQKLSQFIKEERLNLVPNDSLIENVERTGRIWPKLNKEILLSKGGVKASLIHLYATHSTPNLRTLDGYRTDRTTSKILPREAIKKFLMEDGVLVQGTKLDEYDAEICLGSHEGFTRVARCIYHPKENNGMFYPTCGYGLLAAAVATMKPIGYNVHMIGVNRNNGEKIDLKQLEELANGHPSAKTLFLDLKTIAGAVYSEKELRNIIAFCKQKKLFLIIDAAYMNMEFDKSFAFPNVSSLCKQQDYHDFILLYTTSKLYGLERARLGFVLASKKNKFANLCDVIERDLYRVNGSVGDLPFEVGADLLSSSLKDRRHFIATRNAYHRFNMNLMLAYIKGVESKLIDEDVRADVKAAIPAPYQSGIPGIKVVYKPEGGIQMKVDTSGLQGKYYANIRMYNSEIFSYVLNMVGDVVALNANQILDPEGFSLRLSFPVREDVHRGMRAIHDFVKSLTDEPTPNPFMEEDAETFIKGARVSSFQLKPGV